MVAGALPSEVVQERFRPVVAKFTGWAEGDPDVRSALVVGSQARAAEPADAWSDLDLVLFVNEPRALLDFSEWVNAFGRVVLTFVEPTAVGGSRERRVLYAGGLDVDFAIFPAVAVGLLSESPEARAVLRRGYEVILDKDHVWRERISLPAREDRSPLPDAEAFQATFNDFWYHVLWAAKKARRGELWTAKGCCDGYLKRLLLRMVEWRVLLDSGQPVDVWHDGRFLDRWAPPEFRRELPSAFARYDRRDIARALESTARLFSETARLVSRKLGCVYPQKAEAEVRKLVVRTLDESPRGARP